MGSVMFQGAAKAASLALCSAGDGRPCVFCRAKRIAYGSWLLQYATPPMSALCLHQSFHAEKALGTAMLSIEHVNDGAGDIC